MGRVIEEDATSYIVWCSIERVNENTDSYEEVGGSMRNLKEFETLEEAEAWQAALVDTQAGV